MQEPWSLVTMVLLAVLVGVSVPVLIQLFATLRAARGALQRLEPRVDSVLVEVQEASQRINRATIGLDESAHKAQNLLNAAGEVGTTLRSVNRSLRTAAAVGSAVGPAIAAAVHAFAERSLHGSQSAVADSPDRAHEGDES